jgi:hypothetical protein
MLAVTFTLTGLFASTVNSSSNVPNSAYVKSVETPSIFKTTLPHLKLSKSVAVVAKVY